METTGKVIAILPLRSGTGKSGKQWRSQEFVIETDGQYPRKMFPPQQSNADGNDDLPF